MTRAYDCDYLNVGMTGSHTQGERDREIMREFIASKILQMPSQQNLLKT